MSDKQAQKRHLDSSESDSSSSDEWVGPKQTEVQEEDSNDNSRERDEELREAQIKKRKSSFLDKILFHSSSISN
jgi:hypothetical protein